MKRLKSMPKKSDGIQYVLLINYRTSPQDMCTEYWTGTLKELYRYLLTVEEHYSMSYKIYAPIQSTINWLILDYDFTIKR